MQIQNKYEHTLTWLNKLIWPSEQFVDFSSKIFYVFKPYPNGLKNNQIKQWAQLQSKSLSPFLHGDNYQYLSKSGLHLWISQKNLTGIPETALQTTLSDGSHIVTGNKYMYQQTWHKGLLISCSTIELVNIEKESNTIPLQIEKGAPWAVPRKIDNQLKQPSTWLGLTLFLAVCASLWIGVGLLTSYLQQSSAEDKINQLESTLGKQLAKQSQLQNMQQGLLMLRNWQGEFAFLPEIFAQVAEKVNLQGSWKARSISWQNRVINIELYAENIDIAELVLNLENVENLSKINIRPHVSSNTWILEASVK
jgi:hypothetical protein